MGDLTILCGALYKVCRCIRHCIRHVFRNQTNNPCNASDRNSAIINQGFPTWKMVSRTHIFHRSIEAKKNIFSLEFQFSLSLFIE